MFVIKLNLQDMTAGSLSLVRLHRVNPNTAETYFNMLEKVATKITFLIHLETFSTLFKTS